MKKKTVLIVTSVAIIAIGWYGYRSGWFTQQGLSRPPTADEVKRMRAVEESSSKIAPNAKAGAGVYAPGTLPVSAPTSEATSTGSSTDSL